MLVDFAADYFAGGEAGAITRERQRILLKSTVEMLRQAGTSASAGDELVAENLRAASQQLGRLLGRVDVEDLLGVIFSRFCIGK